MACVRTSNTHIAIHWNGWRARKLPTIHRWGHGIHQHTQKSAESYREGRLHIIMITVRTQCRLHNHNGRIVGPHHYGCAHIRLLSPAGAHGCVGACMHAAMNVVHTHQNAPQARTGNARTHACRNTQTCVRTCGHIHMP